MRDLGFVTGSQKTMLAHSALIPPTPGLTHTSIGFILSGMKAICTQNQCGSQAGDQFTEECVRRTVMRTEERGGQQGEESKVYSFTEGNWRSFSP